MPLPEDVRRRAFYMLGSVLCLALAAIVLYYNYILIEPHLHTLFWSMCTSILLTKVKQPLKSLLIGIYNINFKIRVFWHCFLWGNYLYFLFNFLIKWYDYDLGERFMFTVSFIVVAIILLSPFILSEDTLSTILSIVLTSFVLISITLVVARTGYLESQKATTAIKDFIEKNKDGLLDSINSYKHNVSAVLMNETQAQNARNSTWLGMLTSENVTVWGTAEKYCEGGIALANRQYDLVKDIASFMENDKGNTSLIESFIGDDFCKRQIIFLQENLFTLIQYVLNWLSSNISVFGYTLQTFFQTLMDLIHNLKEFVFSSFIFTLFVFYFVKNDSFIIETAMKISPLSEEESSIIIDSVDTNIVKTMYYLCTFGLCNFIVTTSTFYFAGFEIIFIFGFMSSFLSVIPLISNWIIWIPATVFVLSRDGLLSVSWVVIAVSHISLYVIDTIIYSNFFKKQNPTVLGVAILLGVYVFNSSGVIKGPLWISLGICLFDIANRYINFEHDPKKRKRHAKSQSFFDFFSNVRDGIMDDVLNPVEDKE